MPDIFSTDDWQTKINANPAGTIFNVRRAGVHTRAKNLVPKDEQQFLPEIGPNGELPIIDGEFSQNVRFINGANANGVVIGPLEIRHFWRTTFQHGILDFSGGNGESCVVDGVHIHHCIGQAIRCGKKTRIKGGFKIHNVYQSFGGGSDDIIIEDGWWYDVNNPDSILQPYYKQMVDQQLGQYIRLRNINGQYFVSTGWGAGFKLASALRPIVRRCEAGPNIRGGPIWLDVNGGSGYDIYENHVHDCPDGTGITVEVTHGPGKVHDNLVERVKKNENPTNRWGIQIGESSNVEAYNNIVRDCPGGIGIRASTSRAQAGDVARDNSIHHNTIENCDVLAGGTSGDGDEVITQASFNNDWDYNKYRSTKATPFHGGRTFAQWKALAGTHDQNGTFNATAPPTSRHGSSTIGVGFGISGAGKKQGKGSTSVSVTVNVIGSGGSVVPSVKHGISTVDVDTDVVASGHGNKKGAGVVPVAFNVTALGHKEPVPPSSVGSSQVDVAFAVSAKGHKNAHGSSRIDLILTTEVAGEVVSHGSSQVDVGFAVSGNGTKGAIGASQIDIEFGVDGVGDLAVSRHGSSTINVAFDVAPFLDSDDENSGEEPHGTAHKRGTGSVPVAFAITASGRGQTSGGSGGPPPSPGTGIRAPILPEEYRESERTTVQERFV